MQVVANLTFGCQLLLDPARQVVGPIIINSGFRCEAVNLKVGGVRNSLHLLGPASPLHPPRLLQVSQLPKLPKTGIVNIFTKHTSCGLSINENCDPDVRVDMEKIFNRLVLENRPEYEHTLEGADDMPAHAKSTLSGVSITIPITDGRLNLGTWQGVYFCEFRNFGGSRELVVTIIGE